MAIESTVVNHRFELTAGTHMCCMYRGPAERDELLEPYLAEGLWAGDTCFVAVRDEDPRRLRRLQATGGPGRLIIRTAAEPVFDKDFFDIDRIIALCEKTITDALGVEGAAFVRLSAEATWWLTQIPGQEDMLRYEARLNDFAARHPVSVLCLYDIEELDAGVVFDAMKIHPRIWLSWPGPGSTLPEPEPVTKPIVQPDGSRWRCTTAIAAFSGPPGRLVLRSATRPDAAQLFVIERLGQLLGAALMDAELHERDRRRAHELDQLNNQLARTVASLQHRQAVQEAFTNLTIKGSDEQELAAALSGLTGRTVVVRDAFGHETTRVVDADQAAGPSPIDGSDRSSKDLGGSTSIATIGGRRDLGTISFETPPTDDDEDAQFALRYAGTALGLLKAHLQAMGEIENRLGRDLVEDLLEAAVTPEAAEARAAAQGHDLRAPHDVIVVAWPTPEPKPERLHDHAINQVRQAMARQRRPCLVARRRGVLVILAHSGVDICALYNDLCRGLERLDGQVAIGEPALTPQQIPRAYAQARRALTARRQSSKPYGATAYADLGVTRILAIEENAAEVERLISDWLGGLLDYDRLHGADLVPTLAAYLDRGGNYDETARALSVHRNTLRYRLARITKISGHDLTEVDTRLNLHLATRAWMQRHQPPGQSQ